MPHSSPYFAAHASYGVSRINWCAGFLRAGRLHPQFGHSCLRRGIPDFSHFRHFHVRCATHEIVSSGGDCTPLCAISPLADIRCKP